MTTTPTPEVKPVPAVSLSEPVRETLRIRAASLRSIIMVATRRAIAAKAEIAAANAAANGAVAELDDIINLLGEAAS